MKKISIVVVVMLVLISEAALYSYAQHLASSRITHKHETVIKAPLRPATFIQGKPIHIDIPSRGIDLAVSNGIYDARTNKWTLDNKKAFYATVTALPNNKSGNTFIYGHQTKEIFSRLSGIKTGDEAIIKTDNGFVFTYDFYDTYAVNPKDTSVLDHYSGAPMLTLQTCSGTWFENRQMYTFEFKGYAKE